MPTVFTILCSYQKEFEKRPLTQKEKKLLGRRIAFNYDTDERNTTDLPKVKSFEVDGPFDVVDYPENFVPIIVKLIEDFYRRLKKGKQISRKKKMIQNIF